MALHTAQERQCKQHEAEERHYIQHGNDNANNTEHRNGAVNNYNIGIWPKSGLPAAQLIDSEYQNAPSIARNLTMLTAIIWPLCYINAEKQIDQLESLWLECKPLSAAKCCQQAHLLGPQLTAWKPLSVSVYLAGFSRHYSRLSQVPQKPSKVGNCGISIFTGRSSGV